MMTSDKGSLLFLTSTPRLSDRRKRILVKNYINFMVVQDNNKTPTEENIIMENPKKKKTPLSGA
jgi:hypothetical protein